MSIIDDLYRNAGEHQERVGGTDRPRQPQQKLVVVSCMDSRIDLFGLLGLEVGDAHLLRNAGGVITDDIIRSIAISQRLLGTRSVMIIHHTDCGMLGFSDDEFRTRLQQETGIRPSWAAEGFTDVDSEVRQSLARVRSNPFVPHRDDVRGFVYEVETGRLREVTAD